MKFSFIFLQMSCHSLVVMICECHHNLNLRMTSADRKTSLTTSTEQGMKPFWAAKS